MCSRSCQTEVMLSESESGADVASRKLIARVCVLMEQMGRARDAATHGFLARGDGAGTSSLYKYTPREFQ